MEEKKNGKTDTWELFDKIVIKEAEGEKKLFVYGKQYMSWPVEDQISHRMAIVQLYKTGIAEQEELSKVFNIHIKTVYNYITAFEIGGISSLVGETKGPKESWKINPETRFQILEIILNNRDLSYEKISEILLKRWKKKVSRNSIREVLIENGFISEGITGDIPSLVWNDLFEGDKQLKFRESFETEEIDKKLHGTTETIELSKRFEVESVFKYRKDYSPAQRIYLDELEKGQYSIYAGGLLLVPLLKRYNFLDTIKRVIVLAKN